MTPRFQADADLDEDIVTGLLRRETYIDFQTAEAAGLRARVDPVRSRNVERATMA